MKKYKELIVYLIVFAVIIVGAVSAYRYLTSQTPNTTPPAPVTEEPQKASAPDFTFRGEDGAELSLSDMAGEHIVLNFWASWCGPCKMEMPHFEEAYTRYGDKVNFVMVCLDNDIEEGINFARENGYTFPIYEDCYTGAAYMYGASSIPLTVFISPDGSIFARQVGALTEEMLYGYLDEFLK